MTSASTAGSPRSSSRGRTRGTPAGSSSSATSSACRKLLRRKTYPLKGWNSWVPVKEKLKMPPDLVWAYCAITMTFWTWKKNLTKTRRLPWISCCFCLAF